MAYYFISDLHLDKSAPATLDIFVTFLETAKADAQALYILGDFVEYWVGDDDTQHGLDKALLALRAFAENCPVYFMHGNRDFLIGQTFCDQYKLQLIADPYVIEIDQHKLILSHGDILCTDDKEYAKFRQQVRSPEWQSTFLNQTLASRIETAEQLRTQSKAAMQTKTQELMDVNQQAVESCFDTHKINTLIHGHTHRPAIHHHMVNDTHCQRIVLSDWHEKPSYLKVSETDVELVCDAFIKSTTLIS